MADANPLVKFESVALLRDDAGHNRWWLINEVGEVFYHRNSGDSVRPHDAGLYWYDTDGPASPAMVLQPDQLVTLREYLETFSGWPPQTRRDCEDTEHGGWDRLRIFREADTVEVEFHSEFKHELKTLIGPIEALWGGV